MIADLRRQGRTVLLTTHYMDEAERLCDRVAIVDRGKVIALRHAARADRLRSSAARWSSSRTADETLGADDLRALPGVLAVRRQAPGGRSRWTASTSRCPRCSSAWRGAAHRSRGSRPTARRSRTCS